MREARHAGSTKEGSLRKVAPNPLVQRIEADFSRRLAERPPFNTAPRSMLNHALALLRAAVRPGTRAAYITGLNSYGKYASAMQTGEGPRFPADMATLVGFLAWLTYAPKGKSRQGLVYGTVRSYFYALKYFHTCYGMVTKAFEHPTQ